MTEPSREATDPTTSDQARPGSLFSLRRLLRITVSVLVLWLVLRTVDSRQLAESISGLEITRLVAPLLIFFAAQSIYALALQRLLRSLGHSAPYPPILANHYKGLFWSSFLPSTMGGDVYRVIDLGRIVGSRTTAFAAIVAQRTLAMGLALLTVATALPILTNYRPSLADGLSSNLPIVVGAVVLILSAAGFLFLVYLGRLGGRLKKALHNLFVAFLRLLEIRGLLAVVVLLLTSQMMVIYGVGLLSAALGIELSAWHYIYVLPLTLLTTAIPISINGIGIREGSFVVLLGLQSVPAAQAAALGMLLTLTNFFYAIVGGCIIGFSREPGL